MPLPFRVLVVSGDYDTGDALTAALSAAGIPAESANDIATAVELAQQQAYGLVVLEHWPPYLDASRCIQRLGRWLRRTPFLIVDDPSSPVPQPLLLAENRNVLPRSTSADEVAAFAAEILEAACGAPAA